MLRRPLRSGLDNGKRRNQRIGAPSYKATTSLEAPSPQGAQESPRRPQRTTPVTTFHVAVGKLCPRCQSVQPLDQFGNDRGRKDGRSVYCLPCKRGVQARWRHDHIEAERASTRLRYNRAQTSASMAVHRAVKRGKLKKSAGCEDCGSVRRKLEAHHHQGYARAHWLDVVWLCRPCHHVRHRRGIGVADRVAA